MNEEETAVKKDKKAQDFIWTLVGILIYDRADRIRVSGRRLVSVEGG